MLKPLNIWVPLSWILLHSFLSKKFSSFIDKFIYLVEFEDHKIQEIPLGYNAFGVAVSSLWGITLDLPSCLYVYVAISNYLLWQYLNIKLSHCPKASVYISFYLVSGNVLSILILQSVDWLIYIYMNSIGLTLLWVCYCSVHLTESMIK